MALLEVSTSRCYRTVRSPIRSSRKRAPGDPLSREAERSIGYILKNPELPPRTRNSGHRARDTGLRLSGVALRSMQGWAAEEILPEFGRIDSWWCAIFHRYTVDEHSFDHRHLQELADRRMTRRHFARSGRPRTAGLADLALLLHDVGKGMPVENHITGSLARSIAPPAIESLGRKKKKSPVPHTTSPGHVRTVQRRDIFDPATVPLCAVRSQRKKGCNDCAC